MDNYRVTSYYAVVVLGSNQVQICSLKEGLLFTKFFFHKGRASRLVRISLDRTIDITPDYVREAYRHLFPIETWDNTCPEC